MVVMRSDTVRAAQQARGWDDYRLASESGLSYQQIRNMFGGVNCGPRSQQALYKAFGEALLMDELFSVVPDSADAADQPAEVSA